MEFVAAKYYYSIEMPIYSDEKKQALRIALINQGYSVKKAIQDIKDARVVLSKLVTLENQETLDKLTLSIKTLSHIGELNQGFYSSLGVVSIPEELPKDPPF